MKKVISSIWQVRDLTAGKKETIIPKGVIEIIFDLSEGSAIQSELGQKSFKLAKCFINGFNTHPIHLHIPGQHFFLGVQFHPVAIKHLFKIPACEFSNSIIDLTLLDPSFNSLWHRLVEVKTFGERVIILCDWIANNMFDSHPQELLINSFLKNDHLTIKELSKSVYYSPRHLSRKVYELTGMNTEQFLLYKKYLHAVQLIHRTDRSLTEIAYDSHFADQSHFTKSFKIFSHITPNEYRQNKSPIPGHIFKNVR